MTNFQEHIFGLIGYFFKRNIFNILTGQKRDVTGLKLVWPVNKTGHYPKIICSPERVPRMSLLSEYWKHFTHSRREENVGMHSKSPMTEESRN